MSATDATTPVATPEAPSWTLRRRLGVALASLLAMVVGVSNSLNPRPLEAHEVFVAQTSREMLARADWVLPTFNDEPRLKKPPLAYWAVMAMERALSSDPPVPEWKARLPSALSAAALVAITGMIAATLYGAGPAVLASWMVCGCYGLFRYAGNARPEMLYAACCALGVLGLVRSWCTTDGSRAQRWWAWLAWLGAGLGILAKGPHLPALIVLGVVTHALVQRRASRLIHVLRPWSGLVITGLVAGPWIVMVSRAAPDSAGVWFEQMSDAADQAHHTWVWLLRPYYLWGLPALLLPWAVLLPFGLASPFVRESVEGGGVQGMTVRAGRILFWMFAVVFVVLSVSTHRRGYYMLPMLAVLAPLTSAGTLDALRKLGTERARRWERVLVTLLVATAIGFAVASPFRVVWGEGGYRKDEFARRVARLAGPKEDVYLWGEPPGLVTYRLNRVTPEVGSADELSMLAESGPLLLVMPPEKLEHLPAGARATELARQDTGESSETLLLVRVEHAR